MEHLLLYWLLPTVKGTPEEEARVSNNVLSKRQEVFFAGTTCLYLNCEVPPPGALPPMPTTHNDWSDETIWNKDDGYFVWTTADGTQGPEDTKPEANSIVIVKEGMQTMFSICILVNLYSRLNKKSDLRIIGSDP